MTHLKTEMADELNMHLEHIDNGEVSPSILRGVAKACLRGKIIGKTAKLKKDHS